MRAVFLFSRSENGANEPFFIFSIAAFVQAEPLRRNENAQNKIVKTAPPKSRANELGSGVETGGGGGPTGVFGTIGDTPGGRPGGKIGGPEAPRLPPGPGAIAGIAPGKKLPSSPGRN